MNAGRSMIRMASELKASTMTMRRVVKNQLGQFLYELRQFHGLTPSQGGRKKKKWRKLFERNDLCTALFSDEKLSSTELSLSAKTRGY